jgi:hypothetical protein
MLAGKAVHMVDAGEGPRDCCTISMISWVIDTGETSRNFRQILQKTVCEKPTHHESLLLQRAEGGDARTHQHCNWSITGASGGGTSSERRSGSLVDSGDRSGQRQGFAKQYAIPDVRFMGYGRQFSESSRSACSQSSSSWPGVCPRFK